MDLKRLGGSTELIPEKASPAMTATTGALAAPHNGAHLQAQKDAAAAARRSAAQLRRLAMRLVVRLTIYDTGSHVGKASLTQLRGRSDGERQSSTPQPRAAGIPQIERLKGIPGDRKSQGLRVGGSTREHRDHVRVCKSMGSSIVWDPQWTKKPIFAL